MVFVDTNGKLIFEKAFCGKNAGEFFFHTLDRIEEKLLLAICKNKSPLDIKQLSQEELERFHNALDIVKYVTKSLKARTD